MERGFYKNVDDKCFYSKNRVNGPGYFLDIEKYDEYTYPVDGWVYYETAPQEYLNYIESLTEDLNNDPFDELSEEVVLNWVKSEIGNEKIEEIKLHHKNILEEKIEKKPIQNF